MKGIDKKIIVYLGAFVLVVAVLFTAFFVYRQVSFDERGFVFFDSDFAESPDRIVTSHPCEDPELYDPGFGPVDSDTIVLTSASSENLARGFRLDDSTWWDEVYSWPVRGPSDGCPSEVGRPYKSMPWIADTRSLSSMHIRSSIPAVIGNTLDEEGDCTNRYWDGGSSSPPWIKPDSFGGWAKPDGKPQGFSFSVSTEGSVIETCTFANRPRIWYTTASNEGDNSVSLWTQIGGDPNYEPHKSERDENREVHLFSQGVSLFRNEFHLTQEEYDNVEKMQFAARADDWMRIYINGQEHSSLTISEIQGGSTIKYTLSNPKDYLQAGENVMGFQVIDKARWHEEDIGVEYEGHIYNMTESNKVGLWYEVRIVSGEPEPEPEPEQPEEEPEEDTEEEVEEEAEEEAEEEVEEEAEEEAEEEVEEEAEKEESTTYEPEATEDSTEPTLTHQTVDTRLGGAVWVFVLASVLFITGLVLIANGRTLRNNS